VLYPGFPTGERLNCLCRLLPHTFQAFALWLLRWQEIEMILRYVQNAGKSFFRKEMGTQRQTASPQHGGIINLLQITPLEQ